MPARALTKVVFPAPLAPTRPTISPASTSRSTPLQGMDLLPIAGEQGLHRALEARRLLVHPEGLPQPADADHGIDGVGLDLHEHFRRR